MTITKTTKASPAPPAPPVTALTDPAAEAAIGAACRALHLPTIRAEAARIAEVAARERLSHKAYLAEVLTAECDDRDSRRRIRRVNEAKFPRTKRLADFDLHAHPTLPPATLAHLASGAWIDAGEPVVLLGDSGTGKTHLLIALGTAAAEAGRRVRYVTTAALVNELVEAADDKQLSRLVGRYARLDLLCLDLCRHRDYADLGPLNAGQRRRRGWIHRHNPSAPRNARTWTDNSQRPGLGSPASVLRFDGRVNAQLEPGGQTRLWTITRLLVTHHPRPHLLRVPGGNCGDYAEQFGPATPLTSTDRTKIGIVTVSA